jgi:hypothetical protein
MLRDLWRAILGARIFRCSPALLRLAVTLSRDAKRTPALAPRYLFLDAAGGAVIGDNLSQVPPTACVAFAVYFVGVTINLFGGKQTLFPLTQYYFVSALAHQAQRRIARRFPGCAVQGALITRDPSQPEDRADIERFNRQMALEMSRSP